VGKKKLRKMYEAKKEGNEWKIWNNQELRNIYGQPEIIGDIESKRLGWFWMVGTCGKDGGGSNGEKDI
jgi:hypothetical protein